MEPAYEAVIRSGYAAQNPVIFIDSLRVLWEGLDGLNQSIPTTSQVLADVTR